MTELAGQRVAVDVPAGWDGRIVGRTPEQAGAATAAAADRPSTAVLQVSTFPLPPDVGDFGGGAVETMTGRDIFVTLFEYGPESVGSALFAEQGIPRLRPDDATPAVLRRMIDGQAGIQRFFTVNGRAFCLYVVVGSQRRRVALINEANRILVTLRVD